MIRASAPLAREKLKLSAVSVGVYQREPEWERQPRPGRAVNIPVQLLDAMFGACLQASGRQVFPVLITGVLNARGWLGARVHEASDLRLIQRAGVGLFEGVARGAQVEALDRLSGAFVNRAPSFIGQARRARERVADGHRFKARDVNVDEMRVRAAGAAHGAGPTILSRVLVINFDKALVGSLDALKPCERRQFFLFIAHFRATFPVYSCNGLPFL